MSESYKKLVKTLQTIFEMDKADLDFGIYRIMNQKRDDINDFLENDLLSQVKKSFEDYNSEGRGELQQELEMAIEQAKKFGALDPEMTDPVIEIRRRIDSSVDAVALENDVFSKLHTFFSRYYDKGDFISKRRYKADTYSIPYEGEEVKLYWANHDQYYIKSSEHLRDYAFTVEDDKKSVRIKLVKADAEKDNIKEKSGEERRFVLDKEYPLSEENGELLIHFNFLPIGKKKQEKLNEEAVKAVFEQTGFDDWLAILSQLASTDKNPKRTLLERHLNEYTARNTFDYFIHKDLASFLNRELDFFIKNEVLFLDDIDEASFSLTEQQLRKIKIIRSIAKKIIRMLAQLEDFQKKLWLKKKFVIETNYCITLDRIPFDEELFEEIFSNEIQLAEWVKLFAIDRAVLEKDFNNNDWASFLKIDYIRCLIIDTAHFSQDFLTNLLREFNSIDSETDCLLINSENFQALNLLQEVYGESVDCVYIDPPYNTSDNAFLYKNTYKHSSWNSLIRGGVEQSKKLLKKSGVILGAIDDTEYSSFKHILANTFGSTNYIGTTAVEVNPAGQNIRPNVPARSHDYFHAFAKNIDLIRMNLRGLTEQEKEQYSELDDIGNFYWDNLRRRGGNSRPSDRPKQFFPIYYDGKILRVPRMDWDEDIKKYKIKDLLHPNEKEIWPIDPKGEDRIWRVNPESATKGINLGEIAVIIKAGRNEISKKSREPLGKKPKTLWSDSKYSATSHGSKLLIDMFGGTFDFSYPKSIFLTTDSIRYWASENAHIMDFFGGSGTTGNSVINLNREDQGNRKFTLVEMGDYFLSVLKPRVLKSFYSARWKDGVPQTIDKYISLLKKDLSFLNKELKAATADDSFTEYKATISFITSLIKQKESQIEIAKNENDSSNMFFSLPAFIKYQKLESYEDVLNNLNVISNKSNQDLLSNNQNLKEDYMLGYWVDVETADSSSLLNIDQFEDPFNYKLNIGTGSVGATEETTVDLVETFNYLIGLSVKTIDVLKGFKVVIGTNPQDESVLIVWRNTKEKDNDALESFLNKQKYNPRDFDFDHIYINGDHTLEDPRSIVKMIEIEFKRLMFDVEDV